MDQIDYLRKMTGEQRLRQALLLSDAVAEIARQGIKDMYPGISKKELAKKLRERIWGKWFLAKLMFSGIWRVQKGKLDINYLKKEAKRRGIETLLSQIAS